LRPKGMSRGRRLATASFAALLAIGLGAFIVDAGVIGAAASTKKPPAVSLTAGKASVSSNGGAITMRATIRNGAAKCQWSVKPTIKSFTAKVNCGKTLSRVLRLPSNGSASAKSYKVTLVAGTTIVTHSLKVDGKTVPTTTTAPPATTTTTAPPATTTTTAPTTTTTAPPAGTAPTFAADTATTTANVGVHYSYTYIATGSPAPTYAVSAGTLPGGLSLNPTTGVLSGTPTAPVSANTFTVSAHNTAGTTSGSSQTVDVQWQITEAAGYPVSAESTANASIGVDPQAVGDLMILGEQIHSTTISITSVTGGGVTGNWHLAESEVDTTNGLTYEIYYGVATATGAANVTVNYSASVAAQSIELVGDEETTTGGVGTWGLVTEGGLSNASSGTPAWPSLTSEASPVAAQLYWGGSEEHSAGLVGTTPGFNYYETSPGGNVILQDPALAASTLYAPTAIENPADVSTTAAAIFSAT
jgi:hypothetical protein